MLAYFKSVRKRKVAILKEGGRISLKTRKLLSSFFAMMVVVGGSRNGLLVVW